MSTITLEQAQAQLPTLIANLKPGEEVLITQDSRPVARLVAEAAGPRGPRSPGSAVGLLTIAQEDEAHLEDFKGYMP